MMASPLKLLTTKAKRKLGLPSVGRDTGNTASTTNVKSKSPSPNPDWIKTAINTTKSTLEVLLVTVDGIPVPGIKGAIGGLLAVMRKVEVSGRLFLFASELHNEPSIRLGY